VSRASIRGFTLFEFVVVIVMIAVLSGFLLDRVLPLIGQAERVAFLQTKQQIQSALLLEAAERVVRGESASLAKLTAANPMDLLLEPPGNYAGLISHYTSETMPRRAWFFDDKDDFLVYRPGRQATFMAINGPPDRIELRVSFVYEDRDSDGVFNASVDHFDGLRLESLHLYSWPR
jgi:prepilin-type N-terminal cleavage/methylation domain-containing protein